MEYLSSEEIADEFLASTEKPKKKVGRPKTIQIPYDQYFRNYYNNNVKAVKLECPQCGCMISRANLQSHMKRPLCQRMREAIMRKTPI